MYYPLTFGVDPREKRSIEEFVQNDAFLPLVLYHEYKETYHAAC